MSSLSRLRAPIGVAAASLALLGTALVAAPAQAVDTGSSVVISEVYGGGGNTGAPFNKDFIELFNTSASAVSLDGWSVQYGSAGGTTFSSTALSGSIPGGGFYLVAESGGATGAALPTPDATGTLALSASSGKIALSSAATALTCGATCSTDPTVKDFVGFGSPNDAAGTAAPAPSNTFSDQRILSPFTNTGTNSADFFTATPTPKAAPGATPPPATDCSATPIPTECVPGTTTIQDVQGNGFISPLVGTTVSKVEGIVTAVRATGSSRGFWMQEASPDAGRPSASSGVFVFTSTASVTVGDDVLVTGKVSDFYPLSSGETLATTSSLSTTELAPTTVTTIAKGKTLPTPVQISPTTVPDRYAPTVASGTIESIATLDPTNSAIEFWETHEGMRVEVDDARVVGPGKAEFGEIYVTTKPTSQATPRGGTYLAGYDSMPSGRLLIAPVTGSVPSANVGDLLAGPTVGTVDWSTFGGYDIAATTTGTYQDNHLTATFASPQAADQLAIATYNVENLAPSDPASKYAALATGVVANLASPDIISVEEIQDNSGATDDGTVAADQTIAKFTAAITAAGGPTYQPAEIDPVNDADGGQPGGNIRVVFLFNPARVTFDATPGGSTATGVSVSAAADGTPQLSASPGLVDPTNGAWTTSRKPLAGEFTFNGNKVIVVGNHFDSKGGDQNADGRFQPPTRSSEIQRTKQATVLNGFVKQVFAVDPAANVVLAGDFNDYQFAPAITTLTDNGATLTDLINTLPENQRYTYVFNGISQVLDHIFVSKSLTNAGQNAVSYDVIHVNSEFAAQASDHDPQVVRIRPVAHPAPPTTNGRLAVAPTKILRGLPVLVALTRFDAKSVETISLDGVTVTTVKTDRNGAGLGVVPTSRTIAYGAHTVTATTPAGATVTATFTVVRLGAFGLSTPR